MKQVILHCDGSSLGNPGAGGWCGILQFKSQDRVIEKVLKGGAAHTTNNRMELLAVIESIKALKEPCEVLLYSDSRYVCDGINEWLKNWIAKNFKEVKNKDLWEAYIKASKPHKVIACWVKGHSGEPHNEMCDKIAKEMAQSYATNMIESAPKDSLF